MTLVDDMLELAAAFRAGGDEHAAALMEAVLAKHEPAEQAPGTRAAPTEAQAKILAYIKACISMIGRPPTLREICERFGYSSTNAASDHLVALERKGYIAREKLVSRGLRVLP